MQRGRRNIVSQQVGTLTLFDHGSVYVAIGGSSGGTTTALLVDVDLFDAVQLIAGAQLPHAAGMQLGYELAWCP